MNFFSLKREQALDFVCLAVVVLAVYGRALGHDFQTNWDDNWYVLYNEAVRGFSWDHIRSAFTGYFGGYYAPVQVVSYMLDYSLWGLWPGGFILTNILLHLLNGLLIYRLLLGWYGQRLVALVASAIFLVHPVQVEAVAWISQRKSLLALLFFLIAWKQYCRYRLAPTGRGRWSYGASCGAFLLSLLAKPTTVVLPVILVLYDHCFADGDRRSRYADKVPYVLLAGIFSALTLYTQSPEVAEGGRTAYHGGSPLGTLYTMLPVFCRYLEMLVWPAGLSAAYAPPIRQAVDATVVLSALLLAGIAVASVRLYRVDRRLAFWVLFFWVGLLPVSQIVPVISLLYDHYLYLPIIGAAALAGSGGALLWERLAPERRFLLYAVVLPVLAALSVASFQRTGVWKNSLTLWSDAVAKEPGSDLAWQILGGSLLDVGRIAEAREAYQRGFALNRSNTEILHALGQIATNTGELDQGYRMLKRLLELKPDYVSGWASLGTNYMKRGDYGEAERAYQRAHSLQPEAWQVVSLLGNLALTRGRLEEARGYFVQVEAQAPGDAANAYALASVEALSGNADAGLAWLEKAVQRGYDDFGRMYDDPRLSALRDSPRFDRLVRNNAGR
ncbi:Tetratricopeptide TPR_2 repeat protein [Geobacter metallireducens RCH3]|uniref:TPR domain protein n=1 Tax=Geobacter metallireducens (strain ATCC 53774 / DSM 7210 / GS-15) TaxID=269799 RepID=Q39Y43_GEOMG|nr:tetratricopeptide repeat protein [Geobacter metallireducens]ABB30831.1 TPR domain protein [Geobacter metallireducens GS-15]EHP88244.1 Tetratricopeptide TPR_2 repeat protein [Geobacter metallireducens RCH3]MBT1075402.1 tetratricopeptide repeat protein [Geobacter grbiciae]